MTHFLDNEPVEGNTYRGSKSKSGIRGVVLEPRTGRWGARAYVEGRMQWLGTFDTAEQATAAAEEARARNLSRPKAEEKPAKPNSVKYIARLKLSVEDISALVKYEPETGEFFWGPRPRNMLATDERFEFWNAEMVGRLIVGRTKKKRRKLKIGGRTFFAHDIAWAIVHGRWPSKPIIHINGDTMDNRICNLMEASK
jgi:hypothetical protein